MNNTTSSAILTIDIGGSHIKAAVLDSNGVLTSDYKRVETPVPATPEAVMVTIQKLVAGLVYDKVSAGFPGYVKDGVVKTAPNLGTSAWKDFNLAQKLAQLLGKPAKVVNDADLQGIGLVSGKGLELVITLGTGFGTALLLDGKLLPHLEMAHHPIAKNKTYDEYVGEKALEKIGRKKWNKRIEMVLLVLQTVFQYDHLYISGGNAEKINIALGENVTIDSNKEGIKGGSRLWL